MTQENRARRNPWMPPSLVSAAASMQVNKQLGLSDLASNVVSASMGPSLRAFKQYQEQEARRQREALLRSIRGPIDPLGLNAWRMTGASAVPSAAWRSTVDRSGQLSMRAIAPSTGMRTLIETTLNPWQRVATGRLFDLSEAVAGQTLAQQAFTGRGPAFRRIIDPSPIDLGGVTAVPVAEVELSRPDVAVPEADGHVQGFVSEDLRRELDAIHQDGQQVDERLRALEETEAYGTERVLNRAYGTAYLGVLALCCSQIADMLPEGSTARLIVVSFGGVASLCVAVVPVVQAHLDARRAERMRRG